MNDSLNTYSTAALAYLGDCAIEICVREYLVSELGLASSARLNKAADLLSGTDMQIKEIAKLLRFSGTQHFTNLFREQFGISPGKYREKNKRK